MWVRIRPEGEGNAAAETFNPDSFLPGCNLSPKRKKDSFSEKNYPCDTSDRQPAIQSKARYLSEPSVEMRSVCEWQMAIAAASAASSGLGTADR